MKYIKTFETYYYEGEYVSNDTNKYTEAYDLYKTWPKGSWVAFKNEVCTGGAKYEDGEWIRSDCKDIITYGIIERIDEKDVSHYGEFATHTCHYRIKYKTENNTSEYECINKLLKYVADSKDELEAKINAEKYNIL